MRFSHRRLASLASVSLLALLWSGCEAKEQTEYVAGVSTQVKVPRDLKSVRLSVSVGGVRQFCRGYRVYDGRVQLPRSLGTFALNDPKQSGPITYNIIGYTNELEDGSEFDDLRCNDQVGGSEGARILRRSRQPYIENEILFLPLPLKYACFDTNCQGEGQTCKGGLCVDATIDPSKLPKYTPELVDGTGGDCFAASQCMAAALPAIPVNLDDCTFAVPNTPSAPPPQEGLPNPFAIPGAPEPGEGVNVEVFYDGGYVREILDKDEQEGFTMPDPANPQRFRLAPGLCAMFKGFDPQGNAVTGHRITMVRASGTCRAKSPYQPICQGDAYKQMGLDENGVSPDAVTPDGCKPTELKPPRTGLVVVVDDTKEHEKFFQEAGKAAVELAVADPAFNRADIGLVYTSGSLAPQCTAAAPAGIALEPARTATPKIAASFEEKKASVPAKAPGTELPRLDDGLRRAYEALAASNDYFRRAVVLISTREWRGETCAANVATDSAIARATAASSDPTKAIQTYVFDLAGPTAPPFDLNADALAAAGGTGQAVDSRGSNKAPAKDGFQRVVESLATCVYDAPPAAELGDGDTLSYNDPITGTVGTIPFAAGCTTGAEAVDGWGRGASGKVFVCGQPCASYRTTLKNASLVTLPFGKPPPAMPVFAHKAACAPKP